MKLPFKRFYITAIALFLMLFSCHDEGKIKVAIQPISGFPRYLTDTIAKSLESHYGVTTYVLKERSIPNEAFVNIKGPRYRADKIIGIFKQHKPDSLDYIMVLTNQDISITKTDNNGNVKTPVDKYKDWGIFGLGYRPGPSAVISSFRLKTVSETRLTQRLKKIAMHEFGHNLGLDHCSTRGCVMADAAEKISTIDQVNEQLCNRCKAKLSEVITLPE